MAVEFFYLSRIPEVGHFLTNALTIFHKTEIAFELLMGAEVLPLCACPKRAEERMKNRQSSRDSIFDRRSKTKVQVLFF